MFHPKNPMMSDIILFYYYFSFIFSFCVICSIIKHCNCCLSYSCIRDKTQTNSFSLNDTFMHWAFSTLFHLRPPEADKRYPIPCGVTHSCYIVSTWWTELHVAVETCAARVHNIPPWMRSRRADICFSGESTDGQTFVLVHGAPVMTSDPLRDPPPQCFRMLKKYFDLMILNNPPSNNHHHQSHLWCTVTRLAPPPPLF